MWVAGLKLLAPAAALIEAAGESKVPFYVAGGVLAAWAVIVSVIGFKRPEFPRSRSINRLVIAISLVLVLAAAAMAVLTSTRETAKGKEPVTHSMK